MSMVDKFSDPIIREEYTQTVADILRVDAKILKPQNTWSDKDAYTQKAKGLAANFAKNFDQFENDVSDAVKAVAIKP